MAKKSYEQYLDTEPTPSVDDIAIANSILVWLDANATGTADNVKRAKDAMSQLIRYAQSGRVEEWRERKGELARLALIDAGYLDVLKPDELLEGEALRQVALNKVFKDKYRQ